MSADSWAAEDAAMAAKRARALEVARFVIQREDATEREDLLARALLAEHEAADALRAELHARIVDERELHDERLARAMGGRS